MMTKEDKNKYHREWYKKNAKKVNAWHKKHRQNNKEKIRKYGVEYYKKNRDKILTYDRKHVLKGGANRKHYSNLNKRDYMGFCELCSKKQEYGLNYHHWDETNPSKGIWICPTCHMVCNGVEKKEVANKYILLKSRIEEEYNNGLEQ